ncbi:hypothetical protein TNCV_3400761 [Trichonephila clavipes]|nr:hypothetical protein TNCV_3400761 [Trichonephila clavipes]
MYGSKLRVHIVVAKNQYNVWSNSNSQVATGSFLHALVTTQILILKAIHWISDQKEPNSFESLSKPHRVAKSPRAAEQCDVNLHSLTHSKPHRRYKTTETPSLIVLSERRISVKEVPLTSRFEEL